MVAALTAAILATALLPTAAHAAPRTADTLDERPPALVDRDRDRISDGLQTELDRARDSDRFEVIVNTTARAPVRHARTRIGVFDVHRRYPLIDGFHATMTASQVRGLARSPKVFRIEENATVTAFLDASNDDFGTTAARADFGVDGTGAGVCVIDTGADPNHEQLDDGTIAGWRDFVNGRATPYDDNDHGTHVASTAVGNGTGGSLAQRFQGVASGASAWIAKVLNSGGGGTEAGILAGINWCADQADVDVLNLSLGTLAASDGQDSISEAANSAVAAGKVVVVAAGNSGDADTSIGSPGAAADVITVGAVSKYSVPPELGYHTDGIYKAPFSSNGPTLDGRTKPDVMAPGVKTVAALNGTTATYAAFSGTSMATPFVAGAVALAKQANPGLTPAQVKSLVASTAVERGLPGQDNDWGWGLLDGYALVGEAAGATYSPHAFPTNENISGSVSKTGVWQHSFTLTEADLDIPIAATILIDGRLECVSGHGPWCFAYGWSPDLDAVLLDPSGAELYRSECPLQPDCGSVGRQETLYSMPTTAGTYTLQVYPYENIKGGTFVVDLSHGPVEGASEPPPPPANNAPVADDDSYVAQQDTSLNISAPGVLDGDADADGDPLTAVKQSDPANGSVTLNADGSFAYTPASGYSGPDSFTYVANDGTADSNVATVSIDVQAASPPPTGSGVHLADLDATSINNGKTWTAQVTITVHDATHVPADATVHVGWSDGTSASCVTSGGACTVSTSLRKKEGTISLTVTDVVAADPYDQPSNHDPDGDSDGTTIVVTKP